MNEAEELLRRALTALNEYARDGMFYDATYEGLIEQIDAYLSRPADGVVVPREPTEAMLNAGQHVNSEWLNDNAPIGERAYREPTKAVYKAMLSAAPSDRKGGRGMREIPCTHEWYQGTCAHCEATPKQANRIAALKAEIESDNKTIELLTAENAALREEVKDLTEMHSDGCKFSYAVELALLGMKGDYIEIIKALRKDAERYRWLRKFGSRAAIYFPANRGTEMEIAQLDDLDAAIDAAMKESK